MWTSGLIMVLVSSGLSAPDANVQDASSKAGSPEIEDGSGAASQNSNEATSLKPVSAESLGIRLESRIDRAVATTGDVLLYEVEVERDARTQLIFPETAKQIAGFRIVDLGREETKLEPTGENPEPRIRERRWYKLRADLTGSYVLPPVLIGVRNTSNGEKDEPTIIQTSAIFVEVQSVLPEDGSAADIRDIKGLVETQTDIPWIWIGLGAGLTALFGFALFFWRRRPKVQVQVPVAPPEEIAFAALNSLRQTDFNDPLAVRRYYFALTDVLRRYIEDRFSINATDMTTPELIRAFSETSLLQNAPLGVVAALRQNLSSFLGQTDMVKFADHVPKASETAAVYEAALSFVESTVQVPVDEVASVSNIQGQRSEGTEHSVPSDSLLKTERKGDAEILAAKQGSRENTVDISTAREDVE